jgi:hypothetical protein
MPRDPAHLRHAEDDGEHGFAEHDQGQEPEALGQVPPVDRRVAQQAPGRDRRDELDRQRDSPEHVRPRRLECERHEPDDHGDAEGAEERGGKRTRLGDVSRRAGVERQQHDTHRDVRDRKACSCAGEDARDRRGEHGDREHREEHQQPVDDVVGVEAIGIEREAHPGPPDGDEQAEELEEVFRRGVRAERVRQLPDGGDEHEVEEQLEPGRAAHLVHPATAGAQARRLEQPRKCGHLPLNSGLRFSVKAVRPSLASSEANAR